MLVINKSDSTTRFIITITEVNPVTTGSTIDLVNQFNNVNYSFELPSDSSLYPNRYNQFDFSTETFSGLTDATYTYTIKDSNSQTTETGLLKVVSDVKTSQEQVDDRYIYIPSIPTDDDFIVYNQ